MLHSGIHKRYVELQICNFILVSMHLFNMRRRKMKVIYIDVVE